tara:strand:+ start:123 stop:296 length:174 start_codon:yes stop_codon:yes gene_type:complete
MSIEHTKFDTMKEDEGELIAEMLTLTALLGGTMERCDVTTSSGQSYKKIIIEYGKKE